MDKMIFSGSLLQSVLFHQYYVWTSSFSFGCSSGDHHSGSYASFIPHPLPPLLDQQPSSCPWTFSVVLLFSSCLESSTSFSNMSTVSPLHMCKKVQPCLSYFISILLNLRCNFDMLISNPIYPDSVPLKMSSISPHVIKSLNISECEIFQWNQQADILFKFVFFLSW